MRGTWTKSDVVTVVLCAVAAVITAGAVSETGSEEAFRRTCAKNLSELGRAALIYSNDYEGEFPKAGGLVNEWVPTIPNWAAPTRKDAFAMTIDRTSGATVFPTGKTTTSSSLYLLVKYAEVEPGKFVCRSEPKTREFRLSDVKEPLPTNAEFIDFWDFGGRYDDENNPSRHVSYSYHMPFDRTALTVNHAAGMAILADRNPWIDPNRVNDANLGWARFMEASASGDPNRIRIGNSDTHRRDGQNVLFLDTHVAFQTRPTCGVNGDNIYTISSTQSGPGKASQIAPRVYDTSLRPAHEQDSVLVQDLPYVLHDAPAKN
ncbi:MAG: hypothetical protein ACM3VT_06885 [Solirubrobacterales bacterium]